MMLKNSKRKQKSSKNKIKSLKRKQKLWKKIPKNYNSRMLIQLKSMNFQSKKTNKVLNGYKKVKNYMKICRNPVNKVQRN